MTLTSYNRIDLRIALSILLAAFVNFKNPAIGSLIVSFLEIFIIDVIYTNLKSHNKKKLYNKKQWLPVIVFLVFISLSTTLMIIRSEIEEQIIFGLIRYFQILLHIITIIALSMYFFYTPQKESLFMPIPISIVLAGLICLLDYHFNPNSVMSNNSVELPVSYNIRQIGYVVMLGCLFCVVKLFLVKNNRKKIIYYRLLFITNCTLLFWLGGRGATLALSISIILLTLLLNREFIDKFKILVSTTIFMALAYIISIPFSVFSWNGANRFYFLSQNLDMPLRKISSGRLDLWQESISLILQKPFFGYGPEAHAYTTKIGFLQPHNSILQSLLEFGLVGTIPFLIMLAYLIKNAMINAISKPTMNNLFCFGLIVAIFIHSLYSGPLYHATSMILVCISSAYILSVTLKRNDQESDLRKFTN